VGIRKTETSSNEWLIEDLDEDGEAKSARVYAIRPDQNIDDVMAEPRVVPVETASSICDDAMKNQLVLKALVLVCAEQFSMTEEQMDAAIKGKL